jgi:predicted amidohydrolase YtcJ
MKADLLLTNGPIYSGVHPKPFRYLAVGDNRILAIGRGNGKQYIGRNTTIIDLREKSVLPGIIDSHLHLLDYAWSVERVNLERCTNSHEVTEMLKSVPSSAEWVLGRGWNREQFGGFPHKKLLDEIFRDRPAALNSRDGHFLWANSRALEKAGLNQPIQIDGGYVGQDASGSLSGILGENAVGVITSHIPKPSADSRKRSLLAAQSHLHKVGIVGLHSTDGNQAFGDLQELHAESKLKLRVFHSIPLSQLEKAVEIQLKSGLGDDWFQFGFVKIFSDGTLGSQSAAMLEPFQGTNETGLDTIPENGLTDKIRLALENGIAVGIHAIGDRANRQTLNAFEKNAALLNVPRAHSRIEHVQLLHPRDVQRFKKIGIVASMQPHHAISDYELAERYWGPRIQFAYAWRSLLDSGARLIFGSDAPIEDPDPLFGLRAAVHRWNWKDRSQSISPFEALAAYTIHPAEASGESQNRGSLECGKLADFILFSEDPIRANFENCKVVATAIDGKFVYQESQI